MGFRLILELHIPDQDVPNALTGEQQEIIDRFRRDIIGAESINVFVAADGDIAGPEAIFSSGSVSRAET